MEECGRRRSRVKEAIGSRREEKREHRARAVRPASCGEKSEEGEREKQRGGARREEEKEGQGRKKE